MRPLQGALFHKFSYRLMGRVSPYKLLRYIALYSSKERVENQIPGKQVPSKNIPSKNQISSVDTRILKDDRVKDICTNTTVVYTGTARDILSNEEEEIESKK